MRLDWTWLRDRLRNYNDSRQREENNAFLGEDVGKYKSSGQKSA